jgi:hypothetical protein
MNEWWAITLTNLGLIGLAALVFWVTGSGWSVLILALLMVDRKRNDGGQRMAHWPETLGDNRKDAP